MCIRDSTNLQHQNVKGYIINPMDQTDYTDVSIG